MSNGVTDTLESSSILIFLQAHEFTYTECRQDNTEIKWLIKSRLAESSRNFELKLWWPRKLVSIVMIKIFVLMPKINLLSLHEILIITKQEGVINYFLSRRYFNTIVILLF